MRVNWDFKNFSASAWMRAKSTPSSHGNLWQWTSTLMVAKPESTDAERPWG